MQIKTQYRLLVLYFSIAGYIRGRCFNMKQSSRFCSEDPDVFAAVEFGAAADAVVFLAEGAVVVSFAGEVDVRAGVPRLDVAGFVQRDADLGHIADDIKQSEVVLYLTILLSLQILPCFPICATLSRESEDILNRKAYRL